MEVLSYIAMEPPVAFDASRRPHREGQGLASHPARIAGARRPRPVRPGHPRRQSRSSATARKSASTPTSQTETYAALKLDIDNWRWAGVPFYIRAGKRMAKRLTEVTIMFKQAPASPLQGQRQEQRIIEPNFLSMRIQPDDGITLRFGAKKPGPSMDIQGVDMDFSYADTFGPSSNNGYEILLLDAMLGDATLFAHRDGVEATWTIMTPILETWAKTKIDDFPNYPAGTWGPAISDAMLKADGRKWRKL